MSWSAPSSGLAPIAAPPRGRRPRRWPVILAVVLTVLALPFTGRVAWVAVAPTGDDAVAQLRALASALDQGGAARMQSLFPEGEFFTWTLTGVAAARVAQEPGTSTGDREFARRLAGRALAAIDAPGVADRFGLGPQSGGLTHGAFYRGWRLTLLREIATWDPAAATRAGAEATAILDAVDASPSGWLDSYPGQAWPCDTVVALAAATTVDPGAAAPVVARWRGRIAAAYDPATGLLAHRVDAAGRAVEGARGSSQSIIAVFWPALSGDTAFWPVYTDTFVARRLGVVGALEYHGGGGLGDVDSGPLVLGLSASASAVTQAAARAHGDAALADDLNREIELFGLPGRSGGGQTYLLGHLPVAAAFFIWADTTPMGQPMACPAPRPRWWWLAMLPLLPAAAVWAACAGVLIRRQNSRGRRVGL